MNILNGDLVIFVRLGFCRQGRAIYAYPTKDAKKTTAKSLPSTSLPESDWNIDLLDIREVDRGYHLNYTAKKPYQGFDSQWLKDATPTPDKKEYTQFITFTAHDAGQNYLWDVPTGVRLDQNSFPETTPNAKAFVDAIRTSSAQRGDATEISQADYLFIRNLLSGI